MEFVSKYVALLVMFSFLQSCYSIKRERLTNLFPKTNSVLDDIIQRGILRVGTTGDYVPFSYYPESTTILTGIDIDMAYDLGTSLGVSVTFVNTSWDFLNEDLMMNKFDIAMSGVTITLDRLKQFLFGGPISTSGKVAIARDEDRRKYMTIDSINKPSVRVITNPGGTNEEFARANFPEAQLIVGEDNLNVFEEIVKGNADVMATDAIETLVQQIMHPELSAIHPEKPYGFFEYGYMINRDHTWKSYVDQWVHIRINDGTYQDIYNTQMHRIASDYNSTNLK